MLGFWWSSITPLMSERERERERVRGESHIDFCQNWQSFLKPVLNIFIFRNFILGWGEVVTKERMVFCIKSIDLWELLIVGGSKIHQNKIWYYSGLIQTLQKLFSAISRQHFFVKSFNLDVWLVSWEACNKHFILCVFSEDFASWNKAR